MEVDSLIYKLYRSKFIGSAVFSQLYFLKRELKSCSSVLDIGCGADSPLKHCKIPYSVAVDIYKPVLWESKAKNTHNAYIAADVTNLEFKPFSFDAVVLCEVLEHLEKDAGERILEKIESWARKKIMLSLPNGYFKQEALYGNPYQVHRCGWSIEELTNRGYRAYGIVGLRYKPSRFLFFPLAFWAVFSVLLQRITYFFPQAAFEVVYIKDKEIGR